MNDKDTIYRQAAIDALGEEPEVWGGCEYAQGLNKQWHHDVNALKTLQPAQPERKKGKWEICNILDYAQRPTGRKILRCPFCGYLTDEFRSLVDYYHKLTHFCPNCGAEMKGKANDEN